MESVNITSRLEKLKFQVHPKSKINITLCRMVSLPIMRPYLKNIAMNLAAHFVTYTQTLETKSMFHSISFHAPYFENE